jgi:twitching motility protein PilT
MSPSATTRVEWARRLAHSIVTDGYATDAQVAPVLDEATARGMSFPKLLITRDVTSQEVVLGLLSQLSQLPVVDLDHDHPSADALAATPVAIALEYRAVGYRVDGDRLTMAFAEPPDPDDVRALSALVGYAVMPALASPIAIDRLLSSIEPPEAAPAPAPPGPAQAPSVDPMAAGNGVGSVPAEAVSNGSVHASSNGAHGTGTQVVVDVSGDGEIPLHLDDLLRYAVSVGASDLHVTTGLPAMIRLNGAVRPIEGSPVLDNETIRDMVFGILPQSLRERFEAEKELDTSHSIADVGRFRVNVFQQRGTIAAALRTIPHDIPSFEVLGVPDAIRSFTDLRRGLVLVTGPTGSGKSTTLASLVDIINRSKPLHIVTIEDPIEFLHTHKRAMVNQREVGQDTMSFSEALRRVLREDPDVILVGEMRDLETISMALTAAETGHLVFGTLHTQDAPQTIDRIVDVFPTNQQEQVRTMLAGALEGVVTQQLLLNADGTGRLACCEVMMCTSAIRNLIRSAKTHQIYSLMQTGGQYGMQTMDQGLAKLIKQKRITEAVAFDRCRNEEDLRNHLSS